MRLWTLKRDFVLKTFAHMSQLLLDFLIAKIIFPSDFPDFDTENKI